ncbi:TonB-dependent receptor [Nitrospirillum pindoramense]|uniref:Iron complex outermembrane receptor protein n=1 Tax=Nitrospirillum amazonense TaxID=28077 RepID=A0A560GYQ6_9PROT|nr:TonB-dependent receptor [Nitrospirillum amazonense]TWB38550.1 iron complex outermembrane receptor protein [Nitrospirillum amazonense]
MFNKSKSSRCFHRHDFWGHDFLGRTVLRRALLAGSAVGMVWTASAWAAPADANADAGPDAGASRATAGTGSEGVEVDTILIEAERNRAAAEAPVKASLDQSQPKSIISRRYIEQSTPETGDITTTVLIAPSIGGIASNGGGVGETNKTTLRGFADGQYNITYDGMAFGDTNDPTHHPASYFPASTIGSAVVDRGPGAAGDLGQANFGGAIHYFSPTVDDQFGLSQKITFGSFNTQNFVSTIQTGKLDALGGTKVLLNFDERQSDGELSFSGGDAQNQLIKIQVPISEKWQATLFATHNRTHFYQSDAGPGETWAQVVAYGKDFALNDNPKDEHYYKYNQQRKSSDFDYINLKGDLGDGYSIDNDAYTNFYSNQTESVNDVTGLVGAANTSAPGNKKLPKTDIGGYSKGNRYRVFGDILRGNKDWTFGTLKVGGLVETSSTDRHNLLQDLTQGIDDLKYSSLTKPVVANVSNVKTLEDSSWLQYQMFADFELRPIDRLTITPGVKYVNFDRTVDAAMENSGVANFTRGPLHGDNVYDKTLKFLTANYKITPDVAVYAQYATGFLIPSLSTLYVNNLDLNALKPQETTNYQLGAVWSSNNVTIDADIYRIDVTNLSVADPTGQFYVNAGNARYSGVEGQAAYSFDNGVTFFANGSINAAKDLTARQGLTKVPKWTDAIGLLFNQGPWQMSLSRKQVGRQVVAYNGGTATTTADGTFLTPGQAWEIPAYTTTDASVSYDFGMVRLKLAAFNLANDRAITTYGGGLYTFQAGRQIQGTIQVKY